MIWAHPIPQDIHIKGDGILNLWSFFKNSEMGYIIAVNPKHEHVLLQVANWYTFKARKSLCHSFARLEGFSIPYLIARIRAEYLLS